MKGLPRVVVTGVGCVSSCGLNLPQTWSNVLKGYSGVRRFEFADAPDLKCKIAAPIPRSLINSDGSRSEIVWSDKCWKSSDDENQDSQYKSDVVKYSLAAATEAVKQSGWMDMGSAESRRRTGVCFASCLGGLDMTSEIYAAIQGGSKSMRRVSPYTLPCMLPSTNAFAIAKRFGLKGPCLTHGSACAAGSHALIHAYQCLVTGMADRMVAGGSEASLLPIALCGFTQCKALTTRFNDRPSQACRPFDVNRSGFIYGEGAAALCLETLESAREGGRIPLAEVVGVGMNGDAYHLTNIDPSADGVAACMQDCIRHASKVTGLSEGSIKEQIGYVNAHATSTDSGDLIEATAIARVFSEQHSSPVRVGSTKSSTGHLVSASGAIEACFAVESVKSGHIPGNVNLDEMDPQIQEQVSKAPRLEFPTKPTVTDQQFVLSNSFGFGGTNASLLFRKMGHE